MEEEPTDIIVLGAIKKGTKKFDKIRSKLDENRSKID